MQFPTLCLFWTPVFWISNSLVFRGPHLLFSYAKQVGIFLLTLSFSFSRIVCFYSWSNLLVVQVNTIRTKGQCQTEINFILPCTYLRAFLWSLYSIIICFDNSGCCQSCCSSLLACFCFFPTLVLISAIFFYFASPHCSFLLKVSPVLPPVHWPHLGPCPLSCYPG